MLNQHTFHEVTPSTLVAAVRDMLDKKFRLVQICCTRTNGEADGQYGFEISYSFDDGEYGIHNIRLNITPDVEIESVSGLYGFAFIYENEMKDLFGVKIVNINLDFKGTLYKTAIKTPFAAQE